MATIPKATIPMATPGLSRWQLPALSTSDPDESAGLDRPPTRAAELDRSPAGQATLYYDSVRRSSDRADSDDRARALLRAARNAVQRVPPHSRAHRARPRGGPRDLSL